MTVMGNVIAEIIYFYTFHSLILITLTLFDWFAWFPSDHKVFVVNRDFLMPRSVVIFEGEYLQIENSLKFMANSLMIPYCLQCSSLFIPMLIHQPALQNYCGYSSPLKFTMTIGTFFDLISPLPGQSGLFLVLGKFFRIVLLIITLSLLSYFVTEDYSQVVFYSLSLSDS